MEDSGNTWTSHYIAGPTMRRLLLGGRAFTRQPALFGHAARSLQASGLVRLRAVRWLSQAASADDVAAAADDIAREPAEPVSTAVSPNAAPNAIRNRMLRSLKEKNYSQVLVDHEAMVEASMPPDLLALNCIVEAKAQAEGTAAAHETMKVQAAPVARPGWLHSCSECVRG